MVEFIEADVILYNSLFEKNRNLNLRILNEIKSEVYRELKEECFYLDVTRNSVYLAVEYYPKIFKFSQNDPDFISRADNSENFYSKEIQGYFSNSKKFAEAIRRASNSKKVLNLEKELMREVKRK